MKKAVISDRKSFTQEMEIILFSKPTFFLFTKTRFKLIRKFETCRLVDLRKKGS